MRFHFCVAGMSSICHGAPDPARAERPSCRPRCTPGTSSMRAVDNDNHHVCSYFYRPIHFLLCFNCRNVFQLTLGTALCLRDRQSCPCLHPLRAEAARLGRDHTRMQPLKGLCLLSLTVHCTLTKNMTVYPGLKAGSSTKLFLRTRYNLRVGGNQHQHILKGRRFPTWLAFALYSSSSRAISTSPARHDVKSGVVRSEQALLVSAAACNNA